MSELRAFVRESNRIEGITREPTPLEVGAHRRFLALDGIGVGHLEAFVMDVAGAALRDKHGRDVRIGNHIPPRGSPHIRSELAALLTAVMSPRLSPYEAHMAYETLHPFMDGNGRSGRVLWAWMMRHNEGADPFALPFLHRWYYQSLDARADLPAPEKPR